MRGALPSGERGLALLAVLWVVALLSVMALDVLASARREGAVADDLAIRARLEAAADAGLALGIHALLRAEAESGSRGAAALARFRPGAPPLEEAFAGVRLEIAISDDSGRIDLNQAPPALLSRLFEALDVPRPRAEALVAAIGDWRDQDDVPRPRGGAEAAEYRAARLAVPPRNGPFLSVEELRHLRGMTPELFAAAAPALTVHAQRQAPDPAAAGPLVLRALGPAPTAGGAAPPRRGAAAPDRPRDGAPPASALAGRAFRITIEASAAEGRRRREAVVRITGDPRDPWWVHEYR